LLFLFFAWNITTVEINSGVHLLKVTSAKCLCLLPVVLVLVLKIWSCLYRCKMALKFFNDCQTKWSQEISRWLKLLKFPSNFACILSSEKLSTTPDARRLYPITLREKQLRQKIV